jgi:gliding motility-associated lipoprotein GldH
MIDRVFQSAYIIVSSVCFIFLSCTNSAYYENFQTIDSQWDKNKEYSFIYEIEDNSGSYNLFLEIRNNNLYPYQNLWLFCTEEQPEGTVRRDSIECILADDFGKWIGTGISIYHLSVPLRTKLIFPHTGKYTFNIRQGMRDNHLRGIEQIGVRLEKNKL